MTGRRNIEGFWEFKQLQVSAWSKDVSYRKKRTLETQEKTDINTKR